MVEIIIRLYFQMIFLPIKMLKKKKKERNPENKTKQKKKMKGKGKGRRREEKGREGSRTYPVPSDREIPRTTSCEAASTSREAARELRNSL